MYACKTNQHKENKDNNKNYLIIGKNLTKIRSATEYGEFENADTDYKIQIVEFLEDLQYIELAYKLAKKMQLGLPQDSMRLESVRKLVRRLHAAPIAENKPQSSIDFDEMDKEDNLD